MPTPAHSILSVAEAVPAGSLFYFDIDDTVFTSTTYLGGNRWEKDLVAHLMQTEAVSEERAYDHVRGLWQALQPFIQVQLVDAELPQALRLLHQKKCLIHGLTLRRVLIAPETEQQLRSVQIEFHPLSGGQIVWPEHAGEQYGTIHCGEHSKGKIIAHHLRYLKKEFPAVVLIDDKLFNLQGAKALVPRFQGFHFQKKALIPVENLMEEHKLLAQLFKNPRSREILKHGLLAAESK